jgi:hypothetical protein
MNPLAAQSSPHISVSVLGQVVSFPDMMTRGVGTLAPLFVAGFLTRTIGQSTASSVALNSISVTILTNVDIRGGNISQIIISGLTGSSTPDTSNMRVISSFCGTGMWYQQNGSIFMSVSQTIFANTQYVLSFQLLNGPIPQVSPLAYIEVRGSIVSQKVTMTRATGTLSPLFITTVYATLSQSTPSQNVINKLTLNISSYSSILSSTVQMIISNMVNTFTSDSNQNIPLSCDTSTFGMNGAWNKSTGTLIIQPVGTLAAGQNYTVCFLLSNPNFGQDSPAISIEVQALVQGADNSSSISKRLIGKDSGNLAPLLIADFLNVTLGQSTTSQGATNTITATLIPRIALYSTAVITLSGLSKAIVDVGEIALADASYDSSCGQSSSCHLYFASASGGTAGNGMWLGSGNLTLYVVNIINPNTMVKFSFSVTNPTAGQYSPAISIESSGLDSIMTAVAVSKDSGNSAPLAIAGFSTTVISQSTPSQGAINTLTVSLWPYTTLPFNTTLTISNLQGVSLPDSVIALSDPSDAAAQAACNQQSRCSKAFSDSPGGLIRRSRWNNQSKQLTAFLLTNWSVQTLFSFSFPVTNPLLQQASPDVLISSAGNNGIISPLILSKDAWNNAPLLIAGFTLKEIRQSNPLNSATNTIYINCSLNIRLQPSFAIFITIRGLTGSQTGDNRNVVLDMSMSDIQFSNVSWTRANGTLAAPMSRSRNDTLASFFFSFQIVNPNFGQTSPPVYISMREITINPILMDAGPVAISMPLFVYGFLVYSIGQSNSQALGLNSLTVTLQSTVSLRSTASIQAQITISGLFNTTQPTGTIALIDYNNSQLFSPTLNWDQLTGTAVVSVLPSLTFSSFTTYILSFVVNNPAAGAGVVPFINATGSAAQETFFLLPMTVALGPTYPLAIISFDTIRIGQSNPSAGALNTITVTFSTSVLLSAGTLVKISNLTSTNTSDGVIPIKEAGGNLNLGQSCSWKQSTGTLTCTVVSSTVAYVNLAISFILQNPLVGQDSPNVFIEAISPTTPIVPIQLVSASGNAAPLLISRFITNRIEQSTSSSGALNTIRASFTLNVALFGSVSDIWILQAGQGQPARPIINLLLHFATPTLAVYPLLSRKVTIVINLFQSFVY